MLLHVAVGIITNPKGQVLIALRPPQVVMPGLWEFPGGKFEAGEDGFMALKRELQEEIGIEVLAATLFLQHQHSYPGRDVLLHTWWIDEYQGTPIGCEQQEVRWVDRNDLKNYEFPDGNQRILEALEARYP